MKYPPVVNKECNARPQLQPELARVDRRVERAHVRIEGGHIG